MLRQCLQLIPQLGGGLEVLGLYGVAQLRLQGVALTLQGEALLLRLVHQRILRGFRHGLLGLPGHIHRLRELRQQAIAKPAQQRLEEPEGKSSPKKLSGCIRCT